MKGVISVVIFVRTLHIFAFSIEPHNFTCPLQAHWKFLAYEKCNSTLKYYCLYNNVEGRYVEGCNGPDWDRKGSKRIYVGDFSRGDCIPERFQPFRFWTNGSMSDCIYAKSICSEDGQIAYIDNSAKDDRTCRCDYRRNYKFVTTPRHLCYCIPTEEDCSCYVKACPENYTLSADYSCISDSYQEEPKCTSITRHSETEDENTQVDMDKDHSGLNTISSAPRWKDTDAALVLFCLCFLYIFVVVTFSVAVLFHEWTRRRLRPFNRFIQTKSTGIIITRTWLIEKLLKCTRSQTGDDTGQVIRRLDNVDGNNLDSSRLTSDDKSQKNGSFQANVEVYRQRAELTTDEANYLRIIHLLFGVSFSVVRMTFNHEIQRDQLRKTLDKKRAIMEKKYRKKEKIINNFQWNLLYGPVKGKTVTSDGFDIRLMIYLLSTLANIEVGVLYPIQTDTRVSAMLSRIKYIRNEVTQIYDGKLSEDLFIKYWDDIAQAILKLVSLHGIPDDQEKTRFISRLHTLNPIDLDKDKLRKYIRMSDIYPAEILQQFINEYCNSTGQSVEDILREEKHQLYHKRLITQSCCVCNATDVEFCMYIKVIPEKQWDILYKTKEGINSHVCPSNLTKCCESFIPKVLNTCDLSMTLPLILNVPDILSNIINRLYVNKFDEFLMIHKHAIYHSMERKKCCICVRDPTGKILINKKEWDKLYKKENGTTHQGCMKDCYHTYKVKSEIKSSDIDETLLSKICHVAGPISILNKIGQAPFLSFLNWTVDEQILQRAISELLTVINDDTFRNGMLQKISPYTFSTLDENKKVDASKWISKQLQNQKRLPEATYENFVFDKDCVNVESVQIPTDFLFPSRRRHFNNLNDAENNFLVAFYGLTQIVYPVIKHEFDTQCCDYKLLDTIRKDIHEQEKSQGCKESRKDDKISQNKRVYLTRKQCEQICSPKKEESRNFDLKMMIYILKRKNEKEEKEEREEDKEYIDQLNVIDNIRREMVKTCTGVLHETRFQHIMKLMRKAVMHFGGEIYGEKVSNLHHIKMF